MTTVVSVHSFRGGTGKSNATANVAANLARGGARVAVIDTDVQSPGIHTIFGFDASLHHTLDDYLWGQADIASVAHDVTDGIGGTGTLYLVPASMKAADIARILRDGYDVVRLNEGLPRSGRGTRPRLPVHRHAPGAQRGDDAVDHGQRCAAPSAAP